jgi:DNA-binding MarR family transcriptional regulator
VKPHPPSPGTATGRGARPATDAERIALAWRALRRGTAARRMRALAWAPDPPQLNMGQIDSLDLLVTRREWTMCDFAAALGVDPSTATRAVDRLVDIGLATREHSITDKRVTLVDVTQTGRDTQRRVARRRLNVVADALETFTDTERRTLADLLDRLVVELDHAVDRNSILPTQSERPHNDAAP